MAEAPKTDVAAWEPPTSDQEFVFKDVQSAPNWVDKGWASWDRGPALAVPDGDLYDSNKPYTTSKARPGDTIKFMAAKGANPPQFLVIKGAPDPTAKGAITKRPPQESAAPIEDLLRQGYLTADEISDGDKAAIAEISPNMKALVEGKTKPKAQKISDTVKTA